MESRLQPTLWRTCRVLANRRRLDVVTLLARHPGQTVSSVAKRLGLSVAVASQSLRALEARSLLSVRRSGRQVHYRLRTRPEGGHPLVQPLQSTLRRRHAHGVETIFQLCTAFTHPRRVEIYAALKREPRRPGQLKAATRISARALNRHLEKLSARGFIRVEKGSYFAAVPRALLARTLARLVEPS